MHEATKEFEVKLYSYTFMTITVEEENVDAAVRKARDELDRQLNDEIERPNLLEQATENLTRMKDSDYAKEC